MASLQPCVISRGTCRYGWQKLWTLLKRRAQKSPATMEFATLRSEISPLRFATVEMTGVGHRSGQFAPGIDCMLPAAIVISSGGTCRYGGKDLGALMKRRVERSPATMGRATFRREISPLRFAFAEMTGRYHIFLHSPFVFRTDGETVSPFIGLYQQRGEKAGPKSFLCRSAQSMEAERGGQKHS